jgi:hypothetical protein
MRSKQQNEKEKHIIDYIKKLDQKIKKLDKEEKNLDRILNEDKTGDLLRRKEDPDGKKDKKENVAGAYLRSQRMLAPIPVSEKVQQQIDIILTELEITPTSLKPTEKVIELYDDIRKEVLKMLSLHKHIKKRKEEVSLLETKLKDLNDFSKIININSPSQARAGIIPLSRPPQIGPPSMVLNRAPSAPVVPAEKTPASQKSGNPKSPSKDSKNKSGGKKRKATTGAGNKRQRNN